MDQVVVIKIVRVLMRASIVAYVARCEAQPFFEEDHCPISGTIIFRGLDEPPLLKELTVFTEGYRWALPGGWCLVYLSSKPKG